MLQKISEEESIIARMIAGEDSARSKQTHLKEIQTCLDKIPEENRDVAQSELLCLAHQLVIKYAHSRGFNNSMSNIYNFDSVYNNRF